MNKRKLYIIEFILQILMKDRFQRYTTVWLKRETHEKLKEIKKDETFDSFINKLIKKSEKKFSFNLIKRGRKWIRK